MGLIRKFFAIAFLTPAMLYGQYSSDWIQPGQQYFRIPVAKQGVYKLTYSDLQAAGVPVAAIDPRLVQIFHRGQEQAISFVGQDDGQLNNGDYLEFFGTANDGTLDKDLYKPASLQPHNYYNLYSDTTAYFLTWNNGLALGKRIENFDEANVTNLPKENYHFDERLRVLTDSYSNGYAALTNDAQRTPFRYTHFDQGEGWFGVQLQPTSTAVDYEFTQIINGITTAGTPSIEILLVGVDDGAHQARILVGKDAGSLRELGTYAFSNFESLKISQTLQWSDIGADGKLIVRFSAISTGNNRNQFSTAYLKVTYPQSFQSSGIIEKTFTLRANATSKSFVEFVSPPTSMRVWDVTDPSQIVSIGTRAAGSNQTAIVPNTDSQRKLYAFTSVLTPTLKKVTFRNFESQSGEFIIISNKVLMKPTGQYADPVKAYAVYRASEAGGGFDTLVVDIDLLYNQFNYGETSPRAIYEFARYIVDKSNPKYFFLIGKGRDVQSKYHRLVNPGIGEVADLVPSAGYPASDMNFTAGLKDSKYEPYVPVGRITATTPNEVAAYLNKIKETESAKPNVNWQKQGLHLSGGIRWYELPYFRSIVDGFKEIAEGELWGGSVFTFSKRDPNQDFVVNVSEQINSGVNLVTFFGHSSSTNIDIDIGYVTDSKLGYNNPGKYPVFVINGCNAGSFFQKQQVFGENWINAANLGARNFVAHSYFAFSNTLKYYTELLYTVGLTDSTFVNKGIGDVQKEVTRRFMSNAKDTIVNVTQVQQMMLLGDPAVKMMMAGKPDYQISNADIALTPYEGNKVTALSDSFALRLIVKNLGLAKPKPLKIRIERVLPNGSTLTYDSAFNPVLYVDTLLFKIKRGNEQGGGNNAFRVLLDYGNLVQELDETNNESTLNAFIETNSTLNLFPRNYGVVGDRQVKLIWQDSNPFSETRAYAIEVDTSNTFNSPYAIKRTVSGKVLVNTLIDLLAEDSVVYYWRTRFALPEAGESSEWTNSSFAYIKNSTDGWAQLRKNQLKQNAFTNIIDEGEGTLFRFDEQKATVSVTTFGSNNPSAYTDASIRINGSEYNLSTQGQPCRNNTLNMVAFNKSTTVAYAPIPFVFEDPRTCGREPQVINSFQLNEMENALADDMIDAIDLIGASDSVVLFSIGSAAFDQMSSNVKSKLSELGISLTDLNSLQAGEPVIIFGKKGAVPGSARIVRATTVPVNEQLILAEGTITGRKTQGTMKSTVIGPAREWQKIYYKQPKLESSDKISFVIYGVDMNGNETRLTESVASAFDLSVIDATVYPFIRLAYEVQDEVNLTPADWRNWVVLFEPAPEGILLYNETNRTKTIQQGQAWSSMFSFTNISNQAFLDSLDVEIELFSKDKPARLITSKKIAPPDAGESVPVLIDKITSKGKVGRNDLTVYINKHKEPEQYYDNNVVLIPDHVIVLEDKSPPILRVTFDGRLLRNDDYVSPNPHIEISVTDENPFLLMTDTSLVKIYLAYPCNSEACAHKPVYFSNSSVKWSAATQSSPFKIDYTPTDLADGRYSLKVDAEDVTGNVSGAVPYEITFNVNNASGLAYKGVYPNPSSIGFFFSFQLIGNKLPEKFLLEIFSPSGQLVSKFGEEDVARFYMGSNEIVWDGKDALGQTLPSGIYLYRMTVQVNESEKSETGKLVWIR